MIMKKIFTFIAAMLVAFAASATVINITPTSPEASDNLRKALNTAQDGDEIVMAAGTYVESNGNYIAFTGKHVTVKAADGAVVLIQPQVPITISEGGCAHFVGVRFDVSRLNELATWYEHLMYADDATNNSIILDGCELYNFNINKSMLYCNSSNVLASVSINNCYFHDIMKSILFNENTTGAINISITNSTFANIATNTGSYYAGVIDSRATSGSFLVDHCTFYNVQVMNTDYAAIGNNKATVTGSRVDNSIFVLPTSQDGVRAVRGVSAANNCLTFNYIKDGGGIYSSVSQTACKKNIDPLFADTANGDFTLGATSPALGAGTDGSNLGDPFWWPREIYFYNDLGWTAPHVNFYVGSYWDDTYGSGNYTTSPQVGKPNVAMTQVGTSNVWKANYSGLYHYVSFTSESQTNMGNFWNIAGAIYRGDFDANAKQNMFIPSTTSNETKNGVNYYNEGIWVPYMGNSYSVTYEDLNYKTLCLPFGGTLTGANAYTVTGVDEGAGTVTLSEPTTTLTAGVAYIIKPTALTVSVAFAGEPVTVGTLDYLRGNLNAADWKVDNSWWAYILLDNEFCLISSAATANVPQFKAILKANNTSLAPTLRIIETATNIQNIEGNEAAVKFVKNGQLYIQKDGVTYTAAGIAVK